MNSYGSLYRYLTFRSRIDIVQSLHTPWHGPSLSSQISLDAAAFQIFLFHSSLLIKFRTKCTSSQKAISQVAPSAIEGVRLSRSEDPWEWNFRADRATILKRFGESLQANDLFRSMFGFTDSRRCFIMPHSATFLARHWTALQIQ